MSLRTWLLQPSNTAVRSAFGGEHACHHGRFLTQSLGLPRPRPCARPPPHAGYFPPSRRRKWPAVRPCPRGAFSGAPAPSGSRVRTWPSPQDSQCASGQTYLLQPTTLGVLASRLATNLASYPHSPLSRLPVTSLPIGQAVQASQ